MSNYSNDPAMVRVDFWKLSGKWYTTEAVKWTGEYRADANIHDEFAKSLADHFQGSGRLNEMRATCLEPYHEHAHPISIAVSAAIERAAIARAADTDRSTP